MTDVNVAFCRALLAEIKADVEARGYRIMKDAWVYCVGKDHWEFHGPKEYYWHGNAGNAYDARYKGWSAWLGKDEIID